MSVDLAKFTRALACSLLVIGLGLGTGIGSAFTAEQQPLADQIIQALTPKQLTRSLDSSPPASPESVANPAESQFIDSLRNRLSRSITLDEREKFAKFDQDKKGYDNDINFEYNSAKIAPSAKDNARALGVALTSPALKGSTFIIEGYTDAKGGDSSNLKLSERRADAVKRFLVEQYKVPAADLVTVGYGKSRLKNPNVAAKEDARRTVFRHIARGLVDAYSRTQFEFQRQGDPELEAARPACFVEPAAVPHAASGLHPFDASGRQWALDVFRVDIADRASVT